MPPTAARSPRRPTGWLRSTPDARSLTCGGWLPCASGHGRPERISGQQLDDLFQTWLFTASKPAVPAAAQARASRAQQRAAAAWLQDVQRRAARGKL
jgi:hypothetical protein